MQAVYPLFIKNIPINEINISDSSKDYFANMGYFYVSDLIEKKLPEELDMECYQELVDAIHKLGIRFNYERFTKETLKEAAHENNLLLLEELGFSDTIVKKLNSLGIYTRKDLETSYHKITNTKGIGDKTIKAIQTEMLKNGISFIRYGEENSKRLYNEYIGKKYPNVIYTALKSDGLFKLYEEIALEYKKSQDYDELLTLASNMYFNTSNACPKVTIIDSNLNGLSKTTINELRELGIFSVEALVDYQYSVLKIVSAYAKNEIINFMVNNGLDNEVEGKRLNEIGFPYELVKLLNEYGIVTDKDLIEQSENTTKYLACTTEEILKSAYTLGDYKVTSNPSGRLSMLIDRLTRELNNLKEENKTKAYIIARLDKLVKIGKIYTKKEKEEITSTFTEYKVITRKQG